MLRPAACARRGQSPLLRPLGLRAPAVDELHRLADHRQRGEPEEVELDEARQLHLVLRELRDELAVLAPAEGHVFPERLLADDDPRGVHAGRSGEPLEGAGILDDTLEDRLLLLDVPQLRLYLEGL